MAMLDDLCEKPLIDKKRYEVEYKRLVWEVDEFFGDNQILIKIGDTKHRDGRNKNPEHFLFQFKPPFVFA